MRFLVLLLILSCPALAASSDADFLAARDAFAKGQIARLDELAPGLRSHPLALYVEYWQLRSHLNEAPKADIRRFLEDNSGQLPANRLRADWLRLLARQKDWPEFLREYSPLVDADLDLQCSSLQARLANRDSGAVKDAKALWFAGRELPESCTPVFESMLATGTLGEDDVWARTRLAFEAGNTTLAKAVASYLPTGRRLDPKAVDGVVRNPQRFLEAKSVATKTKAQRELLLFALGRTAGNVPGAAADAWRRVQHQLPEDDRAYGWG
ncbi:MAG: transglycosylase, partial [Betaproteobacteria bacterium]